MCNTPIPEITSTKLSTPKPNNSRVSSSNQKYKDIKPSTILYAIVIMDK
jgi:hypothetical protein